MNGFRDLLAHRFAARNAPTLSLDWVFERQEWTRESTLQTRVTYESDSSADRARSRSWPMTNRRTCDLTFGCDTKRRGGSAIAASKLKQQRKAVRIDPRGNSHVAHRHHVRSGSILSKNSLLRLMML